MTDEWERHDVQRFSHILNSYAKSTRCDVAHVDCKRDVKCPKKLYSGSNNLNRAYDVVLELLQGEKRDKPFHSIMQTSRQHLKS